MAKQSGLLKFKGTLDGLTFYKTKDGNLVRTKGGVEKERIMSDPSFIRTRENMSEFSNSASAGKLFRMSARTLMLNAKDSKVTSRLTKIMSQIKNMDTTSVRGERNVGIGVTDPNAMTLLKGFDFNENAKLSTVFFGNVVSALSNGEVTISNITPINDLVFDSAATHVSFRCGFSRLDFATGVFDTTYSLESVLPIDSNVSSVSLIPVSAPTSAGARISYLQIQFFQEINGTLYSLKNGAYNVLNVLDCQQ